jgi:hypothetical protein
MNKQDYFRLLKGRKLDPNDQKIRTKRQIKWMALNHP